MDIPRASSPPSIHVYDINGSHGPHRSSSQSFTNSFSNAQRPMAIPNSRSDSPRAPPPLPPPRHIDDDAAGGIQEIQWRDSFSSESARSGGSVSLGSSLRGSWGQNMAHRGSAGRPDFRRGSSNSTARSRPEEEKRYDFSRHADEGYGSLSGSSLANQQSVTISIGIGFYTMRRSTSSGERRTPPSPYTQGRCSQPLSSCCFTLHCIGVQS